MELSVRPARPDDACVALLYESAKPYYDAYAGSPARAQRLLRQVFPQRGHAASYELCRVALADGPARALYSADGFAERDVRQAADDRVARAVGGPGFVSYFKPA